MMKRKYFIFNKKDQVCVQTEALILHRMENFDQGTGKMLRFKLTRTFKSCHCCCPLGEFLPHYGIISKPL